MFEAYLEKVREKNPLIHNITNYVTVNDCANILLACGASPIMSDDCGEVEEITSICGGLCINIGTLNRNTIQSMLLAGRRANELNHPVILDPVGAGASKLRTETTEKLLNEISFSVIRGNISEIKTIANGDGFTKGVDADISDLVTEKTLNNVIAFTRMFSEKTNAVIVVTGEIDIISDSNQTFVVRNGHPIMAKITGSGCMLSAMITAYVTATPNNILEAAAASVCAMGLCGEKAFDIMCERNLGNSSFRNYLIDEVYKLTAKDLEAGAKYTIF